MHETLFFIADNYRWVCIKSFQAFKVSGSNRFKGAKENRVINRCASRAFVLPLAKNVVCPQLSIKP